MTIYKVVFSSKDDSGVDDASPQRFTYRIEAESTDEAIGHAQIEFMQKHPQLKHGDYVSKIVTDNGSESRAVHTYPVTDGSNPDA